MSLSIWLSRAAQTLDKLAQEVKASEQPQHANLSGHSVLGRLCTVERTAARPHSFGVPSREELTAFRENFSDAFLRRWDSKCAAAGLDRNHAWAAFMEDWGNSNGSRSLGIRFESADNREVYRVADQRRHDSWCKFVFTRDAKRGWVIDDVGPEGAATAATIHFDKTLAGMTKRA